MNYTCWTNKTLAMAINDAIRLLSMIDSQPDFRRSLMRCDKQSELKKVLTEYDIAFTPLEFEEAVTHLHVQCQTLEAAQSLMAKSEWYNYLIFTMMVDDDD
jgi:hypothetical protein